MSPFWYQLLMMIGVATLVIVMLEKLKLETTPPCPVPALRRMPLVVPLSVQPVTVMPFMPAFVWPPTEMPCPAPMTQFVMVTSDVKEVLLVLLGLAQISSSPSLMLQP